MRRSQGDIDYEPPLSKSMSHTVDYEEKPFSPANIEEVIPEEPEKKSVDSLSSSSPTSSDTSSSSDGKDKWGEEEVKAEEP